MAVKEPQSGTQPTDDYLARRTVRSGTAGWVLLAGLGVS